MLRMSGLVVRESHASRRGSFSVFALQDDSLRRSRLFRADGAFKREIDGAVFAFADALDPTDERVTVSAVDNPLREIVLRILETRFASADAHQLEARLLLAGRHRNEEDVAVLLLHDPHELELARFPIRDRVTHAKHVVGGRFHPLLDDLPPLVIRTPAAAQPGQILERRRTERERKRRRQENLNDGGSNL